MLLASLNRLCPTNAQRWPARFIGGAGARRGAGILAVFANIGIDVGDHAFAQPFIGGHSLYPDHHSLIYFAAGDGHAANAAQPGACIDCLVSHHLHYVPDA